MTRAKLFFPGGLKFNLASVKNKHNNEKKYFECVFGCIMRNITMPRNNTGRDSL